LLEGRFEKVYDRLMSSALVILLNQGIKTFIVSLFILLIVHQVVTRHLMDLAKSVDSYDLRQPGPPLSLNRPEQQIPDELDRVVEAIQSMRQSLENAYGDLQSANRDMEAEIGQRRETEQKLNDLVEQLTITNSELQRFAYIASHDLQEPIRGIVLFAQKLENDYRGRLDSNADESLGHIVGNAKHMYELINDLLTFSRLGRSTTFDRVRLDETCRSALAGLGPAIMQAKAKVTIGPMPEVNANPVLMAELLENLIDNAIKFAKPGISPEVTVSSDLVDDEWVISVADNGIGIEPSSQDVFEVFRRHHTQQAYPGTGVGLAICKRIVQLHHGRIWYRSKPGEGSTFFFTLGSQAKSATSGL
ncbi:MAG: two-component sensor histidine kinase, partial [Rhodospirillales bacterium]